MANPNPKTENLTPFVSLDGSEGPSKNFGVRLPSKLAAAVDGLGKRKTEWLRAAIAEKAEREGLI